MGPFLFTLGIVCMLAALAGPRITNLGLELPPLHHIRGRIKFALSGMFFMLTPLLWSAYTPKRPASPKPVELTVAIVHSPGFTCATLQSVARLDGANVVEADVTWENATDASAAVYWIHYDRREVLYAVIPPRHRVKQQSYIGHSWCFRNALTQAPINGVTLQLPLERSGL